VIIPEGFCNVRFLFQCEGVTDPMGFSIACQPDIGEDAQSTAVWWGGVLIVELWPSPVGLLSPWTYVGTVATKTVAGEPQIGQSTLNYEGTGSAAGVQVNTAILIRKITGRGGRKQRGRFFYPPVDLEESIVDQAGRITTSEVVSYQSAWDDIHAAAVTNGFPPWLLHSDPADEPTPITGFQVQSLCATQRRRMR
jgi:hypothetical protein